MAWGEHGDAHDFQGFAATSGAPHEWTHQTGLASRLGTGGSSLMGECRTDEMLEVPDGGGTRGRATVHDGVHVDSMACRYPHEVTADDDEPTVGHPYHSPTAPTGACLPRSALSRAAAQFRTFDTRDRSPA